MNENYFSHKSLRETRLFQTLSINTLQWRWSTIKPKFYKIVETFLWSAHRKECVRKRLNRGNKEVHPFSLPYKN